MSTYLELAQRLRRKCRVTGNGPSAVTGQTEEYARLLDFTAEAWLQIQNMRTDWMFMRASASCATVQGQSSYGATDFGLTDLGYWALDYCEGDTFRNYVTATGLNSEVFMGIEDYDSWRDLYLYGANRTTFTRPMVVARTPDNKIACGPIPAAGYTLIGDYYRLPTRFTAAADVPSLPVQFHDAIVYKAMTLYGASEAAPEVYDDGAQSLREIMHQIVSTQTRRPRLAGALA
jgi:hypothetical protein